jgi:hypothetical protein
MRFWLSTGSQPLVFVGQASNRIELYQLEKYLLQIRSPQPPLLRGARGDR